MSPDLLEIMDADPGMVTDLISLFVSDSIRRLATLSKACADNDFRSMQAQAHSLKGSAIQMGAGTLASHCARLEKFDNPGPELCEPVVRIIRNEFAAVSHVMEEYVSHAETNGPSEGPARVGVESLR